MGKESAKIGQGKAFKEGWIRKDKDTLRANVTSLRLILFLYEYLNISDRLDNRYQSRTASNC